MAAYDCENICDLIRSDFRSKPSPWHHIGYRNGKKLFVTEATLRFATVEQLCSDPNVQGIRHRRKRMVPRKKPLVFDSLFWELLGWLWNSFWSIADGSVLR